MIKFLTNLFKKKQTEVVPKTEWELFVERENVKTELEMMWVVRKFLDSKKPKKPNS